MRRAADPQHTRLCMYVHTHKGVKLNKNGLFFMVIFEQRLESRQGEGGNENTSVEGKTG